MRYFFHLAFRGQSFNGWQRQPLVPSVQETIESALTDIFRKPMYVTGCGRTDSGVHASQFFFHTDIEETWHFDLRFRLNKVLPPSISIYDILPVEPQRHARHDATGRTYHYHLHFRKDPFLDERSSYYEDEALNLRAMKEVLPLLLTTTDFRAFCKAPDDYKHTRCNIRSARMFTNAEQDRLCVELSADRFLSKMVRTIVGKMLDIGREKITLSHLEEMLMIGSAGHNLDVAHPQGLYLSKVEYPYLNVLPRPGLTIPDTEI